MYLKRSLRNVASILSFAMLVSWPNLSISQTEGPGKDASWRSEARWDKVDEIGTADIHKNTTDPQYITPLVSYIPEHDTVPSPRDVLGYVVGSEGHLTHPEDEYRYFEALASASSRVTIQEMGLSEEGRRMILVIVANTETIGDLERYKELNAALADPRVTDESEALRLAEQGKPIVTINAGLHSPETGPPEMVMELAYRLAVSENPEVKEIRENVITCIIPITEVDGRTRTIEWYYRYLSEYEDRDYMPPLSPPYWGAHAYHDNNRDGIQMTLKLTQHYAAIFHEWHPQYVLDLHESVPLMYVSMGTGPYNEMIDPIAKTEWQWVANWELTRLNQQGLKGVWTWGFYTGWNPGYLMWIALNHNSLGRFYETFGNMVPKTMERSLENNRDAAGNKITSEQWYRTNPPAEKVMWSLRNNTNYMQSGVLASLSLMARNGKTMLHNFWKKGYNSWQRGTSEAPYAWIIPAEQPGRDRVAHLVNQLARHKIEVHRATGDFKIGEREYAKGDFVVRLDQPYGNYARNLMRITKFPVEAKYRPYDDVSWTFGKIYRVDTHKIEDKSILDMKALELLTSEVRLPVKQEGNGSRAFVVKQDGSNSLVTMRYMLKDFEISAADTAFEAGGNEFPLGSWLIEDQAGLKQKLSEAAEVAMVEVYGVKEMPEVASHELDLPRVALYHTWTSTQPDGWVRYSLREAGVPFEYINDDDLRAGGLSGRFDVILVAHQGGSGNLKNMIQGRDDSFGPMPYEQTEAYPSHGVIDASPDITGGMGFQGLANLETYLNGGGMLVLMGSAGKLATESGLLRNVGALSNSAVNTPGSAIQTKVIRRDHPLAYGFSDVHHVFRTNGPVYTVPEKYEHWIVVQYGTEPAPGDQKDEKKPEGEFLQAGFVSGQKALERKGVVLDVPRQKGGRVVLYSFNPLHRHLNLGDQNYVFNAVLNWNDFPMPSSTGHPKLAVD